jgi:hypothetical protein
MRRLEQETPIFLYLVHKHRLQNIYLFESMIYMCVGFVTQGKFFVIGKLVEPRERISLPVLLVIHLLKSSQPTKSPI